MLIPSASPHSLSPPQPPCSPPGPLVETAQDPQGHLKRDQPRTESRAASTCSLKASPISSLPPPGCGSLCVNPCCPALFCPPAYCDSHPGQSFTSSTVSGWGRLSCALPQGERHPWAPLTRHQQRPPLLTTKTVPSHCQSP